MNLPALPAVAAPAAPGAPPKNADEPGACGFAKLLVHACEGQGVEPGAPEAGAEPSAPPVAPTGRREGQADASTRDAAADAADAADIDAPTDDAPAEGQRRVHGRNPVDRERKDMSRLRVPTIVEGQGIETALKTGVPEAAEAEAKRHPANIAALLPGWTCTLPLPTPPTEAGALPVGDAAVDANAAIPARRGMARAAVPTPNDAAPRTDARDANQRTAALALPAPAQDAASARPALLALDAARPRAREAEPGLVVGAPAAASPALASGVARPDAVTTVHVAAHIDTPAFAPALATQLRWLAQERVQQAQITLNPAGMGPLSVQIVIDGANARVDFSADVAATRHAIEASLPVLAAALDEGGLKLSGGGVHDGAAQRHPAWGTPAQAHRAEAGPAEPGAAARGFGAAPRAAVARGLVDLVA